MNYGCHFTGTIRADETTPGTLVRLRHYRQHPTHQEDAMTVITVPATDLRPGDQLRHGRARFTVQHIRPHGHAIVVHIHGGHTIRIPAHRPITIHRTNP